MARNFAPRPISAIASTPTVLLVAAALTFVLACFAPAQAQSNVMRIAAVVNDEIISVLDLEQRLRLVALSSNLRLDEQTRRRLLPQVLRGMIDERLQVQEANQNGVSATTAEVDREIAGLAERNNIPPVQFPAFLASNGVDVEALRAQFEAQITWAKYAGRRLSRQVDVSDEEIDEELARLRAVADLPQKRVYEIFLSVDSPDQARDVRANTERLLSQVRGGADFASLARGFSESGTANAGGDLGWISPGQLPEALDQALTALSPGTVSPPIQTVAGYHLLYVTDERQLGRNPAEASVDLVQLTRRLPAATREQDRPVAMAALTAARGQIASCADATNMAQTLANVSAAAADGVRVGDLPGPVRAAIEDLGVGQTSAPVDTGPAVVMVTICGRSDPGLSLPSREQITESLGTAKLELLVRRTMRDLRRAAFIDIRL
jgi:peptidyl-prolyl cis-trans isomerase SurA